MKKSILATAMAALAIMTACNKNDDNMDYTDPKLSVTVESVVTTEAALDDVVEETEYEVDLYSGSDATFAAMSEMTASSELKSASSGNLFKYRYRWQKCPDIHIVSENGSFPKTITLNYGESTELENGRVLSGIIQIVVSASPRTDGATRTVTFQDFSIDSIGIAGTSVKTFHGDRVTERQVTIERNLQFTFKDGTTRTCEAEKTRNWVAGLDTPLDPTDDVIEITGYANCEDSEGNTYRKEITKNLVKRGDCRFIVAGEVTFSKNGAIFATIDYGNGACDRIATITTAAGTKNIEIGKRIWIRRQIQNQQNNG